MFILEHCFRWAQSPPVFSGEYDSAVAQLVERKTVNFDVAGSRPACGAKSYNARYLSVGGYEATRNIIRSSNERRFRERMPEAWDDNIPLENR